MALDLTPEQKATGKANFEQAAGDLARAGKMNTMAVGGSPVDPQKPDRRDFIKVGLAAGAVVPVSAAVYYGYQSWKGNKAVRTALIGTGDEGGVLIGDHNPEFNEFVAVCDVRPSNLDRIFDGEPAGPRKGLNKIYGKDTAKKIERYDDVEKLLADKSKLGLEAVVIATPLNTHDVIAKKCMDAGLHVLCEKLMARTIGKCKSMTQYAKEKGLLLSVGHQRHYSTLYAQALEVINAGVLGDIKHIRAQWPRNNSFLFSATEAEKAKFAPGFDLPYYRDGWCKPILKQDADALPPEKLAQLAFGDVNQYGFKDVKELVRWRLYDKTGGGLMAELGSHQLDASSIILGHVHPLAVSGIGGKFFYGPGRNDRESDDGVWVTYEFPGPKHPKAGKGGTDESDIVIVTYSSFNTNSFEDYGECVMGSRGTMILSKEAEVYLYKEPEPGKKDSGGRDTKVTVGTGGKGPAMESTSTWGGGGGAAISKAPGASAWDSAVRGYRTEMEHFAYCLRRWQELKQPVSYEKDKDGHLKHADIIPRCHGEVAMADAILALTGNMAMDKKERIVFEENWFKTESPEVPETKHASKKA
ncbi:oxidoreductase domain protein : Probable NADH-dependent dehydrogenase OS=Planctomyces maris DSM 8797 GN=PM8797T_28399 PE=4 SV=1: GFO_IDH_MocA [Gemmataceae bacterium]|nr:oxidoreductase domain protein : Probable NADH-dependent dehydrogenase OS=Planctomyces maris DSM 8797 GN=PM8797T_28399 PE=4 SV=1: GFO_IDH_MocA [Gemmataceae bacterium]VTT97673.1 oxidoreductase domain protein : Probable NADH-dependent dehydrogenase OS=Planctomyces maris DSM 8797 GN=PM8797T_28399 PE=4 SV=1: GFO_IDH_MocA [Gemmataceae bacterium]